MTASPLRRIRHTRGLRVVEIAAAAGVSVDTVRRIDRLEVATLKLGSLVRVAQAVGVASTELVPGLAVEPDRASPFLRTSERSSSRKASAR